MSSWHVYILRCCDGTLYTGITNDLDNKRIKAHGAGSGARHTRSRRPVDLVYSEPAESKSAATLREKEVKRTSRRRKIAMIAHGEGAENRALFTPRGCLSLPRTRRSKSVSTSRRCVV